MSAKADAPSHSSRKKVVVSLTPTLQPQEQLAEQIALDLGGSLNVRRTALKLIGLIQPRLADWAMVVLPDTRTGELVVLGDADPHGVVISRARLDGLPLGHILNTGHTE